ncbi:unnamed protein product, partial [Amoebophrya sp. A25]
HIRDNDKDVLLLTLFDGLRRCCGANARGANIVGTILGERASSSQKSLGELVLSMLYISRQFYASAIDTILAEGEDEDSSEEDDGVVLAIPAGEDLRKALLG